MGHIVIDANRKPLAAIIFTEASPSADGISDEMRAVAWTVRNRYEHVRKPYGASDKRWFGEGDRYRSIIEHPGQFLGASTSRYKDFPDDPASIGEPGDRAFATHCYSLADAVLAEPAPATPGRTGTFPYVWFQRGNTSPSPRAIATPTKVGAHWFWQFKDGGERP